MLDRLLDWCPLSGVSLPKLHIAGDLEFIGFAWFRGLELRQIEYVMHIWATFKVELWLNGKIKDRKLGLRIMQRYISISGNDSVEVILMSELIVRLTTFDNDSSRGKAKYIYIMTNMDDMIEASKFYHKRYKIEICFKHLKICGLRLENLAVHRGHKADLIFAVLTLIYIMTIRKGIIHFETVEPQEMRVFYDPKPYIAPAKPVFMQGFECVLATIFSFEEFVNEIRGLIKWVTKKQNSLYQHHYTLESFTV